MQFWRSVWHNNDTAFNPTANISSHPLYICICTLKIIFQTVVNIRWRFELILVKHFKFLWLHLDKQMEQFLAQWLVLSQTKQIESNLEVNLPDYQYLLQANNSCTKLNYTVFSLAVSECGNRVAGTHVQSLITHTYIAVYELLTNVKLNQTCPPGSITFESEKSCFWKMRLEKYVGS